ncbi:hypothetical protein J2W32_004367 [Variovorax boronicumulans]|uniref:Transmembrane protein n=1 Tax=Variovorax boronicumulans TaxID=436515 RepID=A0AAW8CPB2_9BURK|nr:MULTISPECIES: hypothetical protein [Variovorax]MDP9892224.1 hypothetical protein [Variovorax boronicumulans]MDP9995836.1 hypothetical protein [Variovorax boronicumulans]MDQ0006960.1 hypothetical protein [Variovorax boronicumulans]MDQ0055309.1 hypothetical protein [Variovorax boronicumulans]MDQ0611794.1 hypothetical protein [Variovorax sp. W1I1]
MKILSNWRSVRLWETEVERDLHRNHSLRTHGILIGTFTLLLMWGVSALQMHLLHVDSLAVRYFLTLGVGYLGYLLVLRWWARRLVEDGVGANLDMGAGDVVDAGEFALDVAGSVGRASRASGVGDAADMAGGALELAGASDEGAIIVVPVVAIFLICVAVLFGVGSLVLLYFSWDALLAVAIEVAFSYVSARAAVRVAREGWLMAAVRLTWKPLLGALISAVILGALLDHFMPQVNSLPEAVRVLLKTH